MGGTAISDQNFSENALDSTVIQDELLLSYDEEKLFAEQFPHLYSVALCHGVIDRKSDRKAYDKMRTRRKKLKNICQIFASANISSIQKSLNLSQDSSDCDILRRMEEFETKSVKYYQREITFLSNNVDPFHHIIDARFCVLERAFLAKIRSRKRQELAGNDFNYGIDEKRHFLCYFFGRTDFYIAGKKKKLNCSKQTNRKIPIKQRRHCLIMIKMKLIQNKKRKIKRKNHKIMRSFISK